MEGPDGALRTLNCVEPYRLGIEMLSCCSGKIGKLDGDSGDMIKIQIQLLYAYTLETFAPTTSEHLSGLVMNLKDSSNISSRLLYLQHSDLSQCVRAI